MIVVVDYGLGNLFSVHKALEEEVVGNKKPFLGICLGL